jgi:ferritin-like metal-binding protein YciE
MRTLQDLFVDQMRDLYDAEKQLTKALPKVAKAASSPDLKAAVEQHLTQTEGHVKRLEECFQYLKETAKGKHCAAMEGLIKEADELISEKPPADTLDAGLIAAAQKVEHYEIAGYGSLATWAKQMNNDHCLQRLVQTLDEEKSTDQKLTELAKSHINVEAAHA